MRFARTVFCVLAYIMIIAGSALGENPAEERFRPVGIDMVYDMQTGLMWANSDNGEDVDWYGAEEYCQEFRAGGYTDWRLPEVNELATLYTEDRKGKSGFYIIDQITLTDCCVWSSDTNMGGAALFSFKTGKKPAGTLADAYQARALPVRTVKQKWVKKSPE